MFSLYASIRLGMVFMWLLFISGMGVGISRLMHIIVKINVPSKMMRQDGAQSVKA